MSETSSPSVHLHPISPSSSLSSTDSAPQSEPTSDEQPDLGAFTTVLREWTHLQPPPRIPVQLRSATSSTTPTYHAESVNGSDFHSRSGRSRNSRIGTRSALSTLSSFTRPPSSSLHPDGSTVWAHAPIASYLYSATLSNERSTDEDNEEAYTPSPNSRASTAMTVEITSELDFPSFNGGTDLSPGPAMTLPLSAASDNTQETAHPDEEVDIQAQRPDVSSSVTSRNSFREHTFTSSSQSPPSVRIQFQSHLSTTTAASSSSSLPLSSSEAASALSASIEGHSSENSHINSAIGAPSSALTPLTTILNRSNNPIPPRTMSDSSYTTHSASASSSSLSILSYDHPGTPAFHEDSEPERSSIPIQRPSTLSTTASGSLSLQTQRSLVSLSGSTATAATQRPRAFHAPASSTSSTGSPLPNPHSIPPAPEPDAMPQALRRRQPPSSLSLEGLMLPINDLGTPDQPPSETQFFAPSRPRRFEPVRDDEDEPTAGTTARPGGSGAGPTHPSQALNYDQQGPSTVSTSQLAPHTPHTRTYNDYHDNEDQDDEDHPYRYPYSHSHSHTPRYAFAHTPRGIPPLAEETNIQPDPIIISPTHNDHEGFKEFLRRALRHRMISPNQPPSRSMLVHQDDLPQLRRSLSPPASSLLSPLGSGFPQATLETQTETRNGEMPPEGQTLQVRPQPQRPPLTPPAPRREHLPNQSQSHNSVPPLNAPGSSMADQRQSIESYSSSSQMLSDTTHGYPHSLVGLHVLPTEPPRYASANIIPAVSSSEMSSSILNENGGLASQAEGGAVNGNLEPTRQSEAEGADGRDGQLLPSLGFLDEALSFIASERARWTAARDGVAPSSVNGVEGQALRDEDGVGEWRHAIDGEDREHEQSRRKRRRKRSSKYPLTAHEVHMGTPPPSIAEGAQSTPTSSPRKRRSKSAGPPTTSASSFASKRSLLSAKDGAFTPGRGRKKGKEKEFLIPVQSMLPSSSSSLKLDKKSLVTILKRPTEQSDGVQPLGEDEAEVDSDTDGGQTPTNPVAFGRLNMAGSTPTSSPINLLGKKGKRVGRREREKEVTKRDVLRKGLRSATTNDGLLGEVEEYELGVEYDDDDLDESDEEDEDGEEVDEQEEENDSISNMSILQPPRRKGGRSSKGSMTKDRSYIHTVAGIKGAYKSTPGSPRRRLDVLSGDVLEGRVAAGEVEDEDVFGSKNSLIADGEKEKKRRVRPKRSRLLERARSIPALRLDSELGDGADADAGLELAWSPRKLRKGKRTEKHENRSLNIQEEVDRIELAKVQSVSSGGSATESQPAEGKRGRIIALARQLRRCFPEQREELGRVIARIERQGAAEPLPELGSGSKSNAATGIGGGSGGSDVAKSSPIAGPVRKNSKKGKDFKRGHVRAGSEDSIGENQALGQTEEDAQGLVRFPDVEEEEEDVDPRGRPPRKNDALVHVFIDHSNILFGLLSHLKRITWKSKTLQARRTPVRVVLTRASTTSVVTATGSNEKTDSMSAFATDKPSSGLPLPIPASGMTVPPKRPQLAVIHAGSHPIPLPSFATTSRSLPSGSFLSAHMAAKGNGHSSEEIENSKAANSDGYEYRGVDEVDGDTVGIDSPFVVPTKALKEEKKKARKHIWHAALALVLERGRPITRRVVVTSSPLYQPMESIERLGYELRVFIRVPDLGDGMDRERYKDAFRKPSTPGKSYQSSPITATPFSAVPSSAKSAQRQSKGHIRRMSGSTSAESGSAGNGHPSSGITSASASTSQTRVKYREQGVDELLQLKLHQALAATDDVPEGSTIVLATGDGNMGQFNEDGFLGPVRTALRRGWKVELYAWEDGLSRSWKREFGDGTEWGRKGMFRVIAMEQFATALVESWA